MRKFLCFLTMLICVIAYTGDLNAVNAETTPTKPDIGSLENARTHYIFWRNETIPQAEKNVEKAFNAAMQLVNDYRNADASIRSTMYSSLPAGIKANMVSSLVSALGISVKLATDMAKSMTLEGAASTVFGNHSTKLKTFNDYWDGSGTVTWTTTEAKMQKEANTNGVIGVQADSLMEAFHRYEYAMAIYNKKAEAWNNYSPSDPVQIQEISDPIKPGFTKIGCFNMCGDSFDTFSDSETSHRKKCGTGRDVDQEFKEYTIVGPLRPSPNVPGPYSKQDMLSERSAAQGCGRSYYDCPNKKSDGSHDELTCTKWIWERPTGTLNAYQSYKCDQTFRKCMGHYFDHNPFILGKTKHSNTGDSSTEETASTPTPTPTPAPSYHACGTHLTSVSGSHSLASCGTSGHYVCDGSSHVSAGCGISGHYACDSSSHVAAVCGTTGHYNCDTKDHSMQVSCTTHSSCEVINFYACDNHDPAVTCANSHSYNPSNRGEYNMHRTRTCRWCTQTWQKCVSGAPQCLVKTKRTCWAIE